MGDIGISNNTSLSLSTLVGSCVAVCLYDPLNKIAGIAHIMLPSNNLRKNYSKKLHPGKYADEAIETLINRMIKRGAKTQDIWCKLAGGANLFSHESGISKSTIGKKNIIAVKKILKQKKIHIKSEDLEMQHARRIIIAVNTGKVIVTGNKIIK